MSGNTERGGEATRREIWTSGVWWTLLPAVLFWGGFATVSGFDLYVSMLTHGHSPARLVGFELVVCAYWACGTPLIAYLARRFPMVPWNGRAAALHAGAALGLTGGYAAWTMIAARVIDPNYPMSIGVSTGSIGRFLVVRLPAGFLIYAGTVAVIYAFHLYRRAMRSAQLETELGRARLEALAMQIQPHFLFNSLNAVASLVRGNEREKAITTIAGLSDVLRYVLDDSETPEVRMRDELDVAQRYLEIQRVRFGERLTVKLAISLEALEARVPRLILQPLLENCIRHGVAVMGGPAWLSLRAERVNGVLRIEVENGTTSALRRVPGTGTGLRNTQARLWQLYGDESSLQINDSESRFQLTLEIPWQAGASGQTA